MKSMPEPNRLGREKSPYLLQHAHNPVDWYPWCKEAFIKAKAENKPIFLSIGYSTCHWCHVMARECFEDVEVAALLNEHFVSIKVDREERPDLDQIYMDACQMLTGRGGWPLSVFLTPAKKPFFAGTYFPKHSRFGITGLMELLPRLASLWKHKREQVVETAGQLLQAIAEQGRTSAGETLPGAEILDQAFSTLGNSFDERYGGFGTAPKFPMPHQLAFLLRYWKRTGNAKALQMVTVTLKKMGRGGIFDQIGFGFHRYSTDETWLAPHFEKMLYDQALLAIAYLEAYQASAEPEFAQTARAIFEYLLRDLRLPEGAFSTAEDADTGGEEGRFYLWSPAEITGVLGEESGRLIIEYFGVTEKGNFEKGSNILHRPHEPGQFAAAKGLDPAAFQTLIDQSIIQLREARSSNRERPFRDDKILTSWNGLAIAALARGAAVLGEGRFAEAAAAAAAFIRGKLVAPGGRLLRRYRDGEAAFAAYLDDYAFLVWGLLELYQATFNTGHLEWAISLNEKMLALFGNRNGALQFVGHDQTETLPAHTSVLDGAIPSGNSVAVLNLFKLSRLTGRQDWSERGEAILRACSSDLNSSPSSLTYLLAALDFILGPAAELVIAGDPGTFEVEKMAAVVRRPFHPNLVLLNYPSTAPGKDAIETFAPFTGPLTVSHGEATAYLCRDHSCLPPVYSATALEAMLEEQGL